jgi:site-specific recombinase XerD
LVTHLSTTDSRAVLDAPDPASRLGTRDRAMLYVGLTGGRRVSELVGLRLDDVRFDGRYVELRVRGKGRKERALLLWKEVGDALRAWLAIRGPAAVPELFLNARGRHMTRAGFAYVVRTHTATARAQCPALRETRISPHTLRHTCALNILQATGDIRKVSLWLGHAQQSTTEIYLHIDPTEKIAALESSVPVRLRPGRFQPADRLLASLMPSKTPSPRAPD